ncbi:MAG TPA: sigma-70 family RNA polymerase sigma factor [Gemmatimonadaceae bacterium]|jgi:RNA polymerase sigma-70 factor (ECF subfamily)|nr:sigma-70 family RNA polymerase sigma factor [Gemmatimonadaceae bacterium]
MYSVPHNRHNDRPAATYDQAIQDRRWLDAIAAGNDVAFEAAFLHYHSWLLRVAYGLLGSEHDAQEVVQDVMLSFWTRRHVIQVRGSLMSYLYVAVKKRAISFSRKRRVAERFSLLVATRPATPSLESTDALAATSELTVAIAQAVGRLPLKRREIFVLHRFGLMGNTEIATLLNVSIRTVDTQLHRAYNGLRRSLAPWMPDGR